MSRTAGRSAEETRRLILAAAARLLRTQGTTTTLDDIAREAGVSKGGLIYHFTSKDRLLCDLTQDILADFHTLLDNEADPEDRAPGSFTRAYIRVMLAPQRDDESVVEDMVLLGQLLTIPAVAEIARADAEALDHRLRSDGLPPEVSVLVVSAADGANIAPSWGGPARPEAELHALAEQLLALTWPAASAMQRGRP